jgi:hypothetical protein
VLVGSLECGEPAAPIPESVVLASCHEQGADEKWNGCMDLCEADDEQDPARCVVLCGE